MSLVAGVELTGTHVRVVLRDGRRGTLRASHEHPWDPMRPQRAVEAIRAQLPTPARIGIAVGLDALRTALVALPPAAPEARRAMLALEPDRYFLGAAPTSTVALGLPHAGADRTAPSTELAFAVETSLVERWIEAFATWAPVDGVEAAPVAIGRMLSAEQRGTHSPAELAAGGHGVSWGGLSPMWLAAVGAAEAVDAPAAQLLMPPALLDGRQRRRRVRLGRAILTVGVALVSLLLAADLYRARTLAAVDAALTRHQVLAAPVQREVDRLAQAAREQAAVDAITAARLDPVPVLEALSLVLPPDASLQRLRATTEGWQVDGSAADAAGVIRALERDARFAQVRVLAATTRFRDQGRSRESFSIGFTDAP